MDKPTALPDLKSAIEIHEGSSYEPGPKTGDYLVRRDGRVFAGEHLLIDFWGGSHLDDIEFVDAALRDAAEAADATVLHIHLHEFGGEGGYPVSLCSPRVTLASIPGRNWTMQHLMFSCAASAGQPMRCPSSKTVSAPRENRFRI